MSLKPIFLEDHIVQATTCLADALRPLIQNADKSLLNEVLRSVPAYKTGLNNGEIHIATMRALAVLQHEVSVSLAGLLYEEDDDEDSLTEDQIMTLLDKTTDA